MPSPLHKNIRFFQGVSSKIGPKAGPGKKNPKMHNDLSTRSLGGQRALKNAYRERPIGQIADEITPLLLIPNSNLKEIPVSVNTVYSHSISSNGLDSNGKDHKCMATHRQLNIKKDVMEDRTQMLSIMRDVRLKSRLMNPTLFTNFNNLVALARQTELSDESPYNSEMRLRKKNQLLVQIASKFRENCKRSRDRRVTGKQFDSIRPKDPPVPTPEGMARFIELIKFNAHDKVASMLRANPGFARSWDYAGISALHWACIKQDYELVGQLCDMSANVNMTDLLDRTPLYFACRNNDLEIVRTLLLNQANPWSNDAYNLGDIVTDVRVDDLLKRARRLRLINDIADPEVRNAVFYEKKEWFLGVNNEYHKMQIELKKNTHEEDLDTEREAERLLAHEADPANISPQKLPPPLKEQDQSSEPAYL
jgi:hypothetical protein